jgi:hypothetical protein
MAEPSHGWNYKRLVVDTNAGRMNTSVYVQSGGIRPWSPRFYINTVHGTWTAIQCDADGNVLALAHGSTRAESHRRLVAALGEREPLPTED